MNITRELEAYDLAKLVLNNDLKYFFKDAKIVGENKEDFVFIFQILLF